jgi:putative FmdB family regulatory protein
MPLYEYHCQACGHEFDKLTPIGSRNRAVDCPLCGSPRTERATVSLFATGSGSMTGAGIAEADCAPAGGG